MVNFETIKAEEIPFGNNNFLEVAKKRAVDNERTNEFVSISRGFYGFNGEKRFKKSVTIPLNDEVLDFVATKIKEVASAQSQ
ncbi:MAG: hypothetical protein V1870_01925 [Candidatus Aenigmatarchaeota archaeon]